MRSRLIGVAVAAAVAMTLVGVGTAGARGGNAVLNVVHGIPGVDVNVCVNGEAAIPDFKPGDVVAGVELPAGSYDVKIVAAADTCDDAAILEANDVALKAGKNYTAVANLNADGDPNIKLFTNKVAPVKAGKARLTVRHTAAAPAVNVWANGSVLIGGADFVWGDSATVNVPEGLLPAEGHAAGSDGARDRTGDAEAEGRLRVSGLRLGERDRRLSASSVVATHVGKK